MHIKNSLLCCTFLALIISTTPVNAAGIAPALTTPDGRSALTSDADALLLGLQQGEYQIIRQNRPGTILVDFGNPIGNFSNNGVLVGPSQFGWVSYGKSGVHIYPANPIQR